MFKIKASIIIPTRNRAYILKHCFEHILNQDIDSYEVICVDDASEDGTSELSSHFSRKFYKQDIGFKYIRLDKRNGPYVARNVAIKESRGEVIIFIDSDVLVPPQFIREHIALHEKHSAIIVQGMVRHIINPLTVRSRFFCPNAIFWGSLVSQNTSVRKAWLMKAGLFDETPGTYLGFKDIELGIRLQKLGLRFVYGIRKCKAYHVDLPQGRKRLGELKAKHYERGESAYFFVKKHGKVAEKHARTKYIVNISKFFHTDRWVEKPSFERMLEESIDYPIFPIFPILRKFVRYHYRAKGILSAGKQFVDLGNQAIKGSLHSNSSPIVAVKQEASVIIPTRNRVWILKDCLEKLFNQSVNNFEIIVIDDGSEDETEELISKLKNQSPNLKYIKLLERKGCWQARNVGIKEAHGEIIIFVDSDVLVDKNFVKEHLELHKKHSKVTVQGVVRHIRRVENFGVLTPRIDGLCFTGLVIQNCSTRKKWLMDVGLFDETFHMGYMDVELGMRIKKLGIRTVYAFKKCVAYHVDGYPTRMKLENLFRKFEERGKTSWRFIEKANGKNTERIGNSRVVFLSELFLTSRWVEKEVVMKTMLKSIDSPFFFVFPFLKEIMKYHYRAKGIKEKFPK